MSLTAMTMETMSDAQPQSDSRHTRCRMIKVLFFSQKKNKKNKTEVTRQLHFARATSAHGNCSVNERVP